MKLSRIAFFVAFAVASTNAFSADYPKDLFAVSELKFDAYRQACGLDCLLRDRGAQAIASSIAGSMGIHPGYVKLALEIAYPPSEVSGEETRYRLPFPPGYTYCSAKAHIVSLMSASGDSRRASVVDIGITNDHLGVYTWTGRPRPGEGQSSVEGYAVVTGIKPAYFDEFKRKGVCRDAPGAGEVREFLKCKGNPCNPAEDGGGTSAGAGAPDLKRPPAGF